MQGRSRADAQQSGLSVTEQKTCCKMILIFQDWALPALFWEKVVKKPRFLYTCCLQHLLEDFFRKGWIWEGGDKSLQVG